MLVGGGMIDNVGLVLGEQLFHTHLVGHAGNLYHHVFQVVDGHALVFQEEDGRFGVVNQDEPRIVELHQLAYNLAANGARRPRDEDSLPADILIDAFLVQHDGVALKQFFNLDFLYLLKTQLVINPLVDGRHYQNFDTMLQGTLGHFVLLFIR